MRSIRQFLLLGALAVLTLFSFIAALRGYQSSMLEADTLFDTQLLDISQLVANLDVAQVSNDFRLGNNMAFQVWEQERLLAASHHAPSTDMVARVQGFDFANFDGYRWRTYSRFDEGRNRWIMVAERTDLRFVLAENVVLETVGPILFGIPVTGLLIWLIISKGLRPLLQLSAALQAKPVHDFTALPVGETPRELLPVIQAVNALVARLGSALEREKRLSADAAHELRTPIAALKIQLHNLAQEVNVHSDAFRQLQQGVDRMGHLVEQLMVLYRTSPEHFARSCMQVDLYTLAQEVVARWYPLIEASGQTLELNGESCHLQGEPFALETLLENLLSNANKYTPTAGCIRISLCRQQGGSVELLVEDNGPGISVAEQSRIFERFYRVGLGSNEVPGCGLGLTIVQHVAELHHAKVSVGTSSFGSGAAFRVVFPSGQGPQA